MACDVGAGFASAGAHVAMSNARVAATKTIRPTGRIRFVSVIRFFIVFSFFSGATRRFFGFTELHDLRLVTHKPYNMKPYWDYKLELAIPQWGVHPIRRRGAPPFFLFVLLCLAGSVYVGLFAEGRGRVWCKASIRSSKRIIASFGRLVRP